MLGETIKDFKITARLGRGGMGEVYAATQQLVQTTVAIKVLHEEISKDERQVQRFFNEAIAASKIKHAGIVRIFDAGFHERRAYLIMELLEGESLATRLRRDKRLDLVEVLDLAAQLARVLVATHAAGITHRDLKPDNVFLVPDTEVASGIRVKVLDFGIAKLATGTSGDAATALTGSNSSMGTPGYMAPEQWNDAAKADGRTDVYALGCILFELCGGRTPFSAASIGEACTKHLHETPPRIRSLVASIPQALDDLIAKMLAKAPADRPSLDAILMTLDEVRGARPAAAAAKPAVGLAETLAESVADARAPTGNARSSPASREAVVPRETAPTSARSTSSGALRPVGVGVVAIALAVVGWTILRGKDSPVTPPQAQSPAPSATAASDAPSQPPMPAAANVRCPEGMVGVPAATFWMGSDSVDNDNARPKHEVTLRAYCIDRTEVTVEAYAACVARGACTRAPTTVVMDGWSADKLALWSRFCNGSNAERSTHPINCVTWADANAYCEATGKHLPTEAQWELAARGTDGRLFPWGNEPPDATRMNGCGSECRALAKQHGMTWQVLFEADDGWSQTAPVGRYPAGASASGALDMAGNVGEWVADYYAPYSPEPATEPSGPAAGTLRIVRNNDWQSPFPQHAHAATRGNWDPRFRVPYVGFRCASAPGT